MSENQTITNMNALRSRYIRVSSEDKDVNASASNSDFIINMSSFMGDIDNIKGVCIKHISFPNIFYNIYNYGSGLSTSGVSLNNNRFVFQDSGSGSPQIAIVPPGQYTINQFIAALQTAINAVASGGITVTITFNVNTDILTFTWAGGTATLLTANNTMANIVGLSANIGPSGAQTLQAPFNLTGQTELYVHSNTIANGNLYEPSGTFGVVDVVPINAGFGSMVYSNYNEEEFNKILYSPYDYKRSYRQIDIRLRNRDGLILPLPFNFFFNMVLKIYY